MAAFSDLRPILQWKMISSEKSGLFRLYFVLNCRSVKLKAVVTSPTIKIVKKSLIIYFVCFFFQNLKKITVCSKFLHGMLMAVGIMPVSFSSSGSRTSISVFSGWLGKSLTSSYVTIGTIVSFAFVEYSQFRSQFILHFS